MAGHTRGEGGVMRDIKRIEPLLETLRKIWLEHPDYRLMQLFGNVYRGDPYYIEDDDLLQRLESTYLPERDACINAEIPVALEGEISISKVKDLVRKVSDLQAQLRQVEGQSKQQAEEAVIVFAKYTTLRQLVEALPVVDGRMDVECGACYYIRSFIAGQYGVVCGLMTEQSTAMAIKTLLEYRATLVAQDAGVKHGM